MQKEILLAHFPKITLKRYRELTAAFSNIDNAWQAEFVDLQKLGWEDDFIHEFLTWRDNVDEEKIAEILQAEKIHCITLSDENYPALLKQIYDPPICLFVRGEIGVLDYPLAVVGPRKHSMYAKQITEDIISVLARSGVEIISGLAIGVDGVAHEAALRAHGRTLAVLGCGINKQNIYPSAHKHLSEKIIENNGALISEYPPGTEPTKFTFPRRNRIVAGLSLGTFLVEAAENSGALITAQCALDSNREVFVAPQNITSSTATGSNALLKIGAIPVTEAQDILNVLNLQEIKHDAIPKTIKADTPTEAMILQFLSRKPIHIDELTKKTSIPSHTINSTLIIMEMKGQIKNLGNMMYVLCI